MNKRAQEKAINTLARMGVLVSVSFYMRTGMYAQILTQPNKVRSLPLSVAVRYATDMKNGGRYVDRTR